MEDRYQLFQGDCLEVMDELIKQGVKVDAIITDLPYGLTDCKWDNIIPFDEMWKRLNLLIKDNGAIVLFGTQPFTSELIHSNIKNYKHSWVWHKKNAGNILVAKYQPLKTTEDVIVFTKNNKRVNYYPIFTDSHRNRSNEKVKNKKSELFSGIKGGEYKRTNENKRGNQLYPKHLIEFSNAIQKGKFHPTQKPVALLEYLIKTYTLENEIVLDFTMGSGTTGVACLNTNRKFIGIELDEKYFEIAKNRIKNSIKNNKGCDLND